MTPLDRLGADDLRLVITGFSDALRAHKEGINRLNVYPVPDGDTGTNMSLTMESVVTELDGAATDLASTCKAIGYGSLMGARGNSGVILSQILRGFTQVAGAAPAVDGAVFAAAPKRLAEPMRPSATRWRARSSPSFVRPPRPPPRPLPATWSPWPMPLWSVGPTLWPAPPRCSRCWPMPVWSTPAARG